MNSIVPLIIKRAALVTLGLFAAALTAAGQESKGMFRIGYITNSSLTNPDTLRTFEGFKQGLRELGYVEGQNIEIDQRTSEGRYERLPALVAELVARRPDVIVAIGTPTALAAKNATKTIPIVFAAVGDPVGLGLVAAIARPGGNLTGTSNVSVALSAKQFELLKEALPRCRRVAILVNPDVPPLWLRETEAAARVLKVQTRLHFVRDAAALPEAFSTVSRERADALMVLADALFFVQREQIADLASRARLPTMMPFSEHVEDGGLMSYGADLAARVRRAARYVDEILRGAKPADIPVDQPTKFELVINLKAAKAIGVTIPQSLLLRADRVIE